MRIDRDDIPNHIRARKKTSPWRLLAILGIGSAAFWTLAMMFGKPIIIDLEQIKRGIRFADQPVFQPEARSSELQTLPIQRQHELIHQDVISNEPKPATRQTSFNDQNYQPRGAVNTYTPPPAQRIAYTQPERPAKRPNTRITHTANWTWENGHAKNRTGGRFQWTEVNGAIDWNTVCSNYRSGSIEYRDCRKGAKVAFRSMCNGHQPACAAENNFMP